MKKLVKENHYITIIRVAKAMAEKNGDPILSDINILSKNIFQGNAKSPVELDSYYRQSMDRVQLPPSLLDSCSPAAIQSDGGRYYPYIRADGRGQLDIKWPSGIEVTIKFLIPD